MDTKLARETRGGTILQLSLYSELVARIQDRMPERAHVVVPGKNFQPETFRLADYLAYYRYVKKRLEAFVNGSDGQDTYPDPVEQCDFCNWWPVCNDRRRKDDHLNFVAGISKLQIAELRRRNVSTLTVLAEIPVPLPFKPERGAHDGYVKIREQSRLQLEYRCSGTPVYELLPVEKGHDICQSPSSNRQTGDIFPWILKPTPSWRKAVLNISSATQPQMIGGDPQ